MRIAGEAFALRVTVKIVVGVRFKTAKADVYCVHEDFANAEGGLKCSF